MQCLVFPKQTVKFVPRWIYMNLCTFDCTQTVSKQTCSEPEITCVPTKLSTYETLHNTPTKLTKQAGVEKRRQYSGAIWEIGMRL